MSSLSLVEACIPATFTPSLHGGKILNVSAAVVSNLTLSVLARDRFNEPAKEVKDATFCNVTVTYTHPGQHDEINVETWLPFDNYNGRLHSFGGAGWAGGRFQSSVLQMAASVSDGYASMSTDTGTGHSSPLDASWGLLSPGNVDLFSLQNLGSVALNDAAIISKAVIKDFYGRNPDYSYFTGCSQGGRQGLMLAQRYPDAYDGITAAAPAVYWNSLLANLFWPNQIMNDLGTVPHPCEVDALSDAAVAACDELDGVIDGIVVNVDECRKVFDPYALVGKTCAGNSTIEISKSTAILVDKLWNGTRTADGRGDFVGVAPSTDLTGHRLHGEIIIPIVNTACGTDGTCKAMLNPFADQWIRYFLAKDAELDLFKLTHHEYDELVYRGKQEFTSVFDTSDADLTRFRKAGGKMMTYQGLGDSLVPHKNVQKYYSLTGEQDAAIHDYYRYYEIPGMNHCYGGTGQPTEFFGQLRAWVENGTAPESTGYEITTPKGKKEERISCPYPQKAVFGACGDQGSAKCWSCV